MKVEDKISLKESIVKALRFTYSSRSCKDEIVTGNHYQTVTLDGEELVGFRGSRSGFFDLMELEGKSVLDIGSNLGETARNAIAHGAAHVHGVEYDALFVLLADLISIYNGIPQEKFFFEQNDITKKFAFKKTYDVVAAFSVFTYIEKRLEEIAEATREVFIVETHNAKDNWESAYIEPLRRLFPTIMVLGESDWGLTQQFAGGRRMVFVCCKSKAQAWRMVHKIQQTHPALSTRLAVDAMASNVPGVAALRAAIDSGAVAVAAKLPTDADTADSLKLPPSGSMGDRTYWLDFYRGYIDFRQRGSFTDENPYFRAMQRMRDRGADFDKGAFSQMQEDAQMKSRLEQRMHNFLAIEQGHVEQVPAITLFDLPGEPQPVALSTAAGIESGSRLDGYHRLAACILAGRRDLIGYKLKVFGDL